MELVSYEPQLLSDVGLHGERLRLPLMLMMLLMLLMLRLWLHPPPHRVPLPLPLHVSLLVLLLLAPQLKGSREVQSKACVACKRTSGYLGLTLKYIGAGLVFTSHVRSVNLCAGW